MLDTIQCYKILEVEPGSSAERIRRAYIDLVRTWDPDRYVGNPLLRVQAEKKHKEILEAYKTIRFFLPELQEPDSETKKSKRMMRDFKELATGNQPLSVRTVVTVLLSVVIAVVAYSAYYLYQKGLRFTPPPSAVVSEPLEQ